jgi:hypothetical protein
MTPLACLKEATLREWPAKYPGIPFVWNRELDPYVEEPARLQELRWILCSDNPGVEEAKLGCFLAPTGRSGREARKVIAEAGHDWNRQVIVLNKSVIHTPKTADLKALPAEPIRETERFMAQIILDLLRETKADLWVIGFGGVDAREPGWPRRLRGRDAFPSSFVMPHFWAALKEGGAPFADRIFISKHFSHGQFAMEMKQFPATWTLRQKLAALPYSRRLFAEPVSDCS